MKIFKSNVPWSDSFQELLIEWEAYGLINIEQTDDKCCWVNNIGDILLYEHDQLDKLPNNFRFGLFANSIPDDRSKSYPWIYWGRYPKLVNEFSNTNFKKDIESIFIGRIENPYQGQFRKDIGWSNVVEFFSLVNTQPTEYLFAPNDYMRMISRAKFGLSLRGFGPKCQREIELMAVGTVPIVSRLTDVYNYYNPLKEGEHFFFADNPKEFEQVVKNCSSDRWAEMSYNCKEWYQDNCSITGSFKTTEKIIKLIK